MYTDAEGELAVRAARAVVDAHTKGEPYGGPTLPSSFDREAGAFVTLNLHPEGELRGCIGFPTPMFSLREAIVKAAEGATEDPRFPKLQPEELDRVVVEVSILTPPELIEVRKPKELVSKVGIGTDGLIAAQGRLRGLLLPQVPVEWGWDVEEFLAQTCMKAGLLPDAWLEPQTRFYRFQSEIWTEVEPYGPVVRRVLSAHARP